MCCKKESSSFSSKIHSNTIYLDIRHDYQRNYLVNVYKGEGAKEKIKYITIEYANTIENSTGLELTIITDREFSCGRGEPVPIHFPKKRINTWIRLGTPEGTADFLSFSKEASSSSEYNIDLEELQGASYLPLEGLKKHLVKLHHTIPTLLSVNIHVRNNQRIIAIEKEKDWPYLIKNHLDIPIRFSQKGYHIEYTLQPKEELAYYWDSFKAQPAFDIKIEGCSLLVKSFTTVVGGRYRATLASEGSKKVVTITKKAQEQAAEASSLTQGTLVQIKTERISASLLDREENEFGCVHFFLPFLSRCFPRTGWSFFSRLTNSSWTTRSSDRFIPFPSTRPPQQRLFLCPGGW